MYKYFITFLLFISLFTSERSQAQFSIGASLGLTRNTFGGVPPENANYSSITGLSGGLLLDYKIAKDVYLSLQPSYHSAGSDINFGNENSIFNDTVNTYKITQGYFSIPLNLKIFYKNLYVGGGFAAEFLSSSEVKNEQTGTETDITDKFKSMNLVANFNVGYKVSIGKPYLFFEFRYLQGLVNINNTNSYSGENKYLSNFKSKGFLFNTGIMYPL